MRERNQKTKTDLRPFVMLAVMLAVVVLLAVLTVGFQTEDIGFNSEAAQTLDDGWEYVKADGSREAVTLPAELDTPVGTATVLEIVLPRDLASPCTICLRAAMQSVRAYLDGKLIYEFGTGDELLPEEDAGSAWALFRLPDGSAGRTLRLELRSPYESFSGNVSKIYCSSKASILFELFGDYSLSFFIFVALTLIGVILLVMFFSTAAPGIRKPSLLYLALFSFCVGLWILGESKSMQFFLGNEYLITKISYYALLLMPLPVTLYLGSAYKRHTPDYPTVFFWLFTANLIVSVVLALTGKAYFFHTLLSVHLLLLALIVVTLWALIYEVVRYRNREAREQLVGLGILGVSGVLELLSMWSSSYTYVSKFLRVGILLYVAYMGAVTFRRLLTQARESREAEYFQRLAYTDVVTRGNNRAAFERDAGEAFAREGAADNWLVLFDLDRLKIINDVIGHQTGDDAIRQAYGCLTEAFSGTGVCYRIGGDEFACIVRTASEADVDGCLRKLGELVCRIDDEVDYDFGISYGKGRFDPENGDFRSFFMAVDKTLYSDKEKKHQTPPVFD